jgi:hypothetical protein
MTKSMKKLIDSSRTKYMSSSPSIVKEGDQAGKRWGRFLLRELCRPRSVKAAKAAKASKQQGASSIRALVRREAGSKDNQLSCLGREQVERRPGGKSIAAVSGGRSEVANGSGRVGSAQHVSAGRVDPTRPPHISDVLTRPTSCCRSRCVCIT